MSKTSENTITSYLGHEFQLKLIWQLLVEPEFAERVLPSLAIEYFDDPNIKRFFIIIIEFYREFEKVPNYQNKSIRQAINRYKAPNNEIESEVLFGVLKQVELWNENVINRKTLNDGDVVQKATNNFIKQQEYRKLGEFIIDKTKSGEIKNKHTVTTIEEKFQKVSLIGEVGDDCEEIFDNIDRTLRKEFRKTIPTGIEVIDSLTGGGLGKGEIGVILTPSGVGKTTILTKIANTAYLGEYNVAQIIFEDTKDQVKRKHYTIWSKVALSKMDDDIENAKIKEIIHGVAKETNRGKLIIKKFSQENTTITDVRNWMLSHEKKFGYKFDMLVLDYLDCLESHKKTADRNEAELAIIKGFETLSSDFDIPAWTAIQSNRSGFDAEYVEAHQSGGSIKRIQKAHFFMSVAKTPDQKVSQLANIRIIKARFAADGQTFENCIFNNDTMEIRIEDDRYKYDKLNQGKKHHDSTDIDKLESNMSKVHVAASQITEGEIIGKANNDTVNEPVNEPLNDMLEQYNKIKKENEPIKEGANLIKDETVKSDVESINIENEKVELKNNTEPIVEVSEDDFIDPDDIYSKQISIRDRLIEERKNQVVTKKE